MLSEASNNTLKNYSFRHSNLKEDDHDRKKSTDEPKNQQYSPTVQWQGNVPEQI